MDIMKPPEGFPARLTYAMQRRGMSDADVADKAYISASTVYRYRTGTRYPNVYTATLIAKALNVSMDWLCDVKRRNNDQS